MTTAPDYGAELETRDELTLVSGVGIEGDRYAGSRRQVTIVCTGELAKAAAEHGIASIDGAATRRNIVVDCDSLPREHGTRFRLGEAELEVWRDCAPCELMDEFFGDGARSALQQRAGISAQVIRGGAVRIGDTITR